MTELLAPAGDLECAKVALYNGCDAIYCATNQFGARAYAKNLTLEELDILLTLAHSLKKKVYVTVNTILKDSELKECIKYVKTLYKMGVDGLILADFAIINYVIDNLPGMEAHISTQCGVKDLNDVLFFSDLNAKRVVLARENTIEEIKTIKENSNMPLEIFAHGALCVSYSGGCLMSSMLSLRSGNRGRCSQNCRRDYTILKNGNVIGPKASWLSMKDLNTFENVSELVNLGIDSLKLEGRMKNPDYVKIITNEYRKKIDNPAYTSSLLEHVFHRNYTKGFIFNEDKGKIVDSSKKNREGEYLGTIIERNGKLTKCELNETINVGDRLRIESDLDYYFTVDKLFDKNQKEVQKVSGICYINILKNFNNKTKVYRMVDSSIDTRITNLYKTPIIIDVYGTYNTPLTLKTTVYGKTYTQESNALLDMASNKPIDTEVLTKQLGKLNDTSFYLKDINNNLVGDLFMTISSLNETRRNLINLIEQDLKNTRTIPLDTTTIKKIDYEEEDFKITAFCTNEEQFETLKSLGIDTIYFKNYSPYVEAKYEDFESDYVLVGNYGGIKNYSGKTIISDYSFNVINAKAIYDLHRFGVNYVTLSLETSLNDIKNITNEYKAYGNNPNIEITVYGKQNLMTTKYCPLRGLGECGKCNDNKYVLKDEIGSFELYHRGCITHIINEKPLNLIDDLKEIVKYTNRIRLSFTTENKNEVSRIVKEFKERIKDLNNNKKLFDSKNNTRGYYKREII